MFRKLPVGVWALAALKVVLHLSTTRLGHHRDELYFIAASKRLSFSYVDFQPVVPLLVRAERLLLGESLLGLRLIPAVAGAASIVLAALIARELGGGRKAQLMAAFALLVVPLFVGMSTAVNTVSVETPAWLLVTFVVARMARTQDRRLWIALGASIGLALLVKFTVLAYLGALGIAILLAPIRRQLGTRWPWIGAGVAAVLVAPVIVWQARNGFPVVEFVRNQDTGGRVLGLSGRGGFVASLLILPGPVAPLFLLVPGMIWLIRSPVFRLVGITHAGALLVLLAASGKGYYAAPALAVLLAAGAVAIEGWTDRARRWLGAGLVVNLLASLILVLPLTPISWLSASEDLNQATEMGERIGWEDLARTVSEVVASLEPDERPRAVVVGANYAISAAVEHYAEPYGLPPAVSGHNSAYLWWPDLPPDHVAIAIGLSEELLQETYRDVEPVGSVTNRHGVRNYEWGRAIYVARGPLLDDATLRERLKIFTA